MAAKKTSTKKAGTVASTGSTKKVTKKPATKKAGAKKASATTATAEVKATKKAAPKKAAPKKAAAKKAAPKKAAPKKAAPKKAAAKKAAPKKATAQDVSIQAKPATDAGVAPVVASEQKQAVRPKKVLRVVSLGEVQEMVAREAYYIAERRHFQGGNQTKDWLDAEAAVYANLKQANIVVQR